jgi:hypothetical protein
VVAPCDKYQGLVVGPDGQTVADPYGMLPTLADYEEWRGVADNLITRAEAELTRFFEEHGAIPEDIYIPVEAVRARWDEMHNAIGQAFADFPQVSWGSTIEKMVQIARDGACQIGVVESDRVLLGGEPTDTPTDVDRPANGGKGTKTGKGIGGLLLILAAAYFAGGRRA